MAGAPEVAKEEKIAGVDKWQVESDLRTLIDARKILKDGKRVKAVRQLMKIQAKATDEVEAQLQSKTSQRMKKTFNK